MSTANFNITKVMDKYELPLMVMSDEMLYEYITGEEPTEDIDPDDYAWEIYNGFDFLVEDIEADFDKLKSELKVFSIELVSGYYSGIQFKIDTQDLYFDYLDVDKYKWDKEDLWAFFNECTIEGAKNCIEKELKLIREFLENMKNYGFRPLNCDGVFSNGEAIYSWAD